MRALLRSHRPFIIGLQALDGKISPQLARYALREGIVRGDLAQRGHRVRPGEDGFSVLLRVLEQATIIQGRITAHPAFAKARDNMFDIARATFAARDVPELQSVRSAFESSRILRKIVQLGRAFPREARKWRQAPPKRFTLAAIERLQAEYEFAGKAFENSIRVIASFSEACASTDRWNWWSTAPLGQVLGQAAELPHLALLPAIVDRKVRNALAHGVPEIHFARREVVFHDVRSEVRLGFDEFLLRTRELTASAVPMLQFAEIEQFEHARLDVESARRAVAEEAMQSQSS